MANNKLFGYTPKTSNEKDGNRLDHINPFEFRKGMDYELITMGCYRLAESTVEEREKATELVVKNLEEHGAYYSCKIQYETQYRNAEKKPSFSVYLKEYEEYQMKEVDQEYKNDKMEEPEKYNKEDYTVPFKTQALKESIKQQIRKALLEQDDDSDNDDFDEIPDEVTDTKARQGGKKITTGVEKLEKEEENLKEEKASYHEKIKPLIQSFNNKDIDKDQYLAKISKIKTKRNSSVAPAAYKKDASKMDSVIDRIGSINKRLKEIEKEKEDIVLREKQDRYEVASTAMDRQTHYEILNIIKEYGINLREGSEAVRPYYEIAKIAYMEGLTAGLKS
jgi:hypothetical protein